jgi:general secretion pathway protein G
MAKRRHNAPNIILPWERRGGLVRRLGLGRARPFVVATAVVALLALIGVRERERTGVRTTRAALLVVRRAVDLYRADHEGKCPRQLDELRVAGYLGEVPDDAWGHELRLRCPGRKDPAGYDLTSDGPDGEPGGLDRVE